MFADSSHKGISRLPDYVHPILSDLPGAEDYLATIPGDGKILVGSCHCQAVKFAVKAKPLESAKINDCACSICLGVSRSISPLGLNSYYQNGVLWLYPLRKEVFWSPSVPSKPFMVADGLVTKYTFAQGENGHYICKKCGCQVFESRHVSLVRCLVIGLRF